MYSREIKERLQSMTIEEKARLCAGKDFWQTWGDEGSGIPPMRAILQFVFRQDVHLHLPLIRIWRKR